jgi:hypothetical protein
MTEDVTLMNDYFLPVDGTSITPGSYNRDCTAFV